MDIPYLARRARLVLGQTQSQFAEQFEVDDGTVSRWERGKLRPSRAIIAKLREIVLRLSFAHKMLEQFLKQQALHIADRDRLIKELSESPSSH